jgi:hypothetical protein
MEAENLSETPVTTNNNTHYQTSKKKENSRHEKNLPLTSEKFI